MDIKSGISKVFEIVIGNFILENVLTCRGNAV